MIELQDLSFSYGPTVPVLRHVNFSMENGHCAAILGNNGVGKSSLLKCIVRILKPQSGHVLIDRTDVFSLSTEEAAKKIAYVAQNAHSSDLSVFDTVLLGRRPYIRWDATDRDKKIVVELLERLGLKHLILRSLSQLSGGEAQKVLLARALAQEPKLLLLDEPTSNLDPRNQHEVMQLIREIAQKEKICVLTVLHDLNLAIRYCDRFLLLKDHTVYASGGLDCMTPETIEQVYGMHVHRIETMGIPVIVPFPDVVPATGAQEGG